MILIKSDKLVVGNKLTCTRQFGTLFRPGAKYRIIKISDVDIKISDEDYDDRFGVTLQLDKNMKPNIFDYFKLW